MSIIEFKPEQENEEEYIYRICSAKEESGMTWEQIAGIINTALGRQYNESTYRKKYQMLQNGAKVCAKKIFTDDEYLKEIQRQTDELYKAKRQFQDQRREYHNILVKDARAEHLAEELIDASKRLDAKKMLVSNEQHFSDCDHDAVLCLADWHFGMTTNNIWNEYNTNICVQRINILLEKVQQYLRDNHVDKLHIILLGDFIHGAIHNGCRVASEEDTCDQLMTVSEILAELIDELSNKVNDVYVYSTYGNHARTIQNKHDSIHSDNMEKIIPFWLKQRLNNNSKVHIVDSVYYEFIYCSVCGHDVVAVHGDLERFDKLGADMHTLFAKQYGIDVEYVFSGDKHHSESNDMFGIDNVMVSALCGTDEFANNKRLYSKPGQTLCIFNQADGKICTYNITF